MRTLYLIIRGVYLYGVVFPLLLGSFLLLCLALVGLGAFDREYYAEAWEFLELDELTSLNTIRLTFTGARE